MPPSNDDRANALGLTPPPPKDERAASLGLTPPTSPTSQAGGIMSALGKGILHGAGNPLYGGAQIGARMQEPTAFSEPDATLATRVDAATKAREESYRADPTVKAHPTAAAIGTFGGETAANLPLMALPGGMPSAALAGAAAAVTEPSTGDDFWSDKKRQSALGLIGGGVAGGVGNVVGRAIAPSMGKAAQMLADAGVSLTPGQALGGIPRRAEEAAKSFPVLGSFIRGAEGRSLESFNSAVINQALEPISKKLPKDLEGGPRGAIAYAADSIGAAYERVLPKMAFREDPQFVQDLDSLRDLVKEMPPAQVEQFSNILKNRVGRRLAQGNMDGITLNQTWSELGNFAATYRTSSDAAQRQLGIALEETRAIIGDALARQNPPKLVTELENARASYAMLTRIETAANRRAGSSGAFTPIDLLSAIRSGDRTVRHRAFAHGDALMQEFAQAGQDVLPGKLPDSGTVERGMWDALGLLGPVLAGELDKRFLSLLAPAAASPLYTSPAGRLFNRYVNPGAARRAVGDGISGLNAILGVPGGIIGGQQ